MRPQGSPTSSRPLRGAIPRNRPGSQTMPECRFNKSNATSNVASINPTQHQKKEMASCSPTALQRVLPLKSSSSPAEPAAASTLSAFARAGNLAAAPCQQVGVQMGFVGVARGRPESTSHFSCQRIIRIDTMERVLERVVLQMIV